MTRINEQLLEQIKLNLPASEEVVRELLQVIGKPLPGDYLEFLRMSNGGVGHGPNLFVILNRAEELVKLTRDYGGTEYAPGLLIIGGDGCGALLGIDTRADNAEAMDYIWMDAIGIGWDNVLYRTDSFESLLLRLDRDPLYDL